MKAEVSWRGLELVEGLSTTEAHWSSACGHVVSQLVMAMSQPTGESADWWPDPSDPLRMMRVIPHWSGKGLLAVSEDEPRTDNQELTIADVAVHKLDLPNFGRAIAQALGFSANRPVPILSESVARLGHLYSHGIEIFLAIPCQDGDLLRALELIRARFHGAFALITPTSAAITNHISAAIDNGLFQHATLDEMILVRSDGGLSLLWPPAECFSPAAGIQTGPPYERWPLDRPPRANWGDVTILLREPDVLWIQFGSASREFTSADIIGLVKASSGQHTSQAWELMRHLADANGILPSPSKKEEQNLLRATRKGLSDILRRFFGIDSLPFSDNRRSKVWAANFGVGRGN